MAAVAAPAYLAARHPITTPQDLTEHNCINLRLPTYGSLYVWEFEKNGRELNVHVEGQIICNDVHQIIDAALDGFGICHLLEDTLLPLIKDGKLQRVLEDWCPPFPGYHLYYPSRRQPSPAFSLVVEALRYKVPGRAKR
jgi:DNA-binding transcriptional LysR family regulator